MRQIIQSLKDGSTEIVDVPCPAPRVGHLLVRSRASLVSAGTERMLVEFGKANWLEKARQQPDKVKAVLDKIKTDGLAQTIEAVRNKLDRALPMGYCNTGVVMQVGADVGGFVVGDRVASNGGHAEVVSVPANLCAKVPQGVSDDQAAFTVLGAVALQGIRLVQPSLGEAVAVSGLGLVGLLAVQLLRAQGCRVLGLDFDPARLALARRFGADVVDLSTGTNAVATAEAFSRGRGMDAVIIAASTTSSEPVHQAARMSRKRGRIILVGVTGLELSRADFYEKELSFQVSCSYGPGRYDPNYESKGHDYPAGFVRWTAQRNFEAVLDMMADGRLDIDPLVSHRFPLGRAEDAYSTIAGVEPSLGVLIEYPERDERSDAELRKPTTVLRSGAPVEGTAALGFVGAGGYASGTLIPAFRAAGAQLMTVSSLGGLSGVQAAKRFGFARASTDVDSVIHDPEVGGIVIATRHDSHAELVQRALRAGKHVFVEKPLAIDREGLASVEAVCAELSAAGRLLMVGFNRRFAAHAQKMRSLVASVRQPKSFLVTVNAGALPSDHWTLDATTAGGRIVGEACHFIDLVRFLAGSPITACQAMRHGTASDDATIALTFADGSAAAIHYLTSGSRKFPKERVEVFAAGGVLQLDNFRRLKGYGWPGFSRMNLWRQDKGQAACAAAFLHAIRTGEPAIPQGEIFEVSEATLRAAELLRC